MFDDRARAIVEHALTDEMRVEIFGLGETHMARARASIESSWRNLGGGENLTIHRLENNLRSLQREAILLSTGQVAGNFSANLRISEHYRFFRAPAIETAARTVDGYGQVIGSILSTRERLTYEYGSMARNVFIAAHAAATTIPAIARALRFVAGASRAAQMAAAPKALTVALIPAAMAQFAIGYVGALVAQELGERVMAGRATRLAIQSAAPEVIVPERIIDDFAGYRSTRLMGEGDVYPILGTILFSTGHLNVSPEMFGMDYSDAIDTTRRLNLSAILDRNTYLGFTERSLVLSGLYGRDMTDTMATMSRINLGREIDDAAELFQTFFSSMVSDGRLHVSQLNLVDELASFSEQYVLGTRLNIDDGPENLARIHAFVNPIYGDRQSTSPTQALVSGLDSVLETGATGTNQHVSTIMARTGITRSDALTGVTAQPDTLEQFLYGMYLQLGIGASAFGESGELGNEDMMRFVAYAQHGLGMDDKTLQATLGAYRAFVGGARMGDVTVAYAKAFEETAVENYPEYGVAQLATTWSRGSRALTDVVFSYADVMVGMNESILDLASRLMPVMLPAMQAKIEKTAGRTTRYTREIRQMLGTRPEIRPEARPEAHQFTYDDIRFRDLSGGARSFKQTLFANLALNNSARLTGISGVMYNSDDARIRGRTNFGTDVVIGPRGSDSPIYFPFRTGRVVYVGLRTNSGGVNTYGLSVVINLDNNHQVSFSHLSGVAVSRGDILSKGDLVGRQGATGLATGAHVDIEFRRGARMDGNTLVGSIISDPEKITQMFSPFLRGYAIGGRVPGPSGSASGTDSQAIPNYVNIDLEMNGINSQDFASYFTNHFTGAYHGN